MTDDFAEFYSSSFNNVARAARAFCGDSEVAYEASQEAFARAFSRWSKVRKSSFPEAWVTTTALNITKRHFKSRRPEGYYDAERVAEGPSVDRLDLLVALRALPERQRQAVVLHYLMDTPIHGVAEVMGISEGAVKAHLHKARAALKRSGALT